MAGFTRGSHGNGAGPDRGERLPPGRYDVGSHGRPGAPLRRSSCARPRSLDDDGGGLVASKASHTWTRQEMRELPSSATTVTATA